MHPNRISSFLSPAILLKIYKVANFPILDYCCTVWGFCSKNNSDFLERLQNRAMRIIVRTNHLTCTQSTRERLGLLTLAYRHRYLRLQLVYKIINDYHSPRQLQGFCTMRSELCCKVLRNNRELDLTRYKTAMGQSTFEYAAVKELACSRLSVIVREKFQSVKLSFCQEVGLQKLW